MSGFHHQNANSSNIENKVERTRYGSIDKITRKTIKMFGLPKTESSNNSISSRKKLNKTQFKTTIYFIVIWLMFIWRI